MKAQKIVLNLILIGILFTSCSKDDDLDVIEQTPQYPMKTLIETGHMELKSTMQQWVFSFEVGYKFKAFKNGKITALGIRVPNNDTYRVTLWNAETEEVLVTKNIVSSSGLLSFEAINPVNVTSGVAYFVSVNTNDYYTFNDSGNVMFPVESGDILITGYGVRSGTNPDQVMPTQYSKTSYVGVVDIKFMPNP
ncbi:DUF4082 domain-containing protein [Snuella sedimenti]|uniref:DUF4082 domain-containing protein n=1 Tax=Snuella sedimenti TaxID=2798802 RepID=A0A8J7J4W6_9FLAO|nr:DUF4082 domain-containing protein [Snuella sedimenti]MBJ6368669.1 DUF4082 domain-containing protein [Snuella sedimenti]